MVKTIRVSVTLTEHQVNSIDHLIEKGVFLNRGQFINEYVRKGLREFGLLFNEEARA